MLAQAMVMITSVFFCYLVRIYTTDNYHWYAKRDFNFLDVIDFYWDPFQASLSNVAQLYFLTTSSSKCTIDLIQMYRDDVDCTNNLVSFKASNDPNWTAIIDNGMFYDA